MQDELIKKVSRLMTEQTAAYTSLESLMQKLIVALTATEPCAIESISKAGETELFRMRSRLVEITSSLTAFADMRNDAVEVLPLCTETREEFESAAGDLLKKANSFESLAGRAASLALGGMSFAAAGIQVCGVPPTTYQAPVLKYAKG